jgi:hypothetical protein
MVHIIGLNHRAQARTIGGEFDEEQKIFRDCLLTAVEQIQPILIAEEDSEEALAVRRRVSIAKSVAVEKGIEHRFCDPTTAERQAIGYRDGQMLECQLFMADRQGLSNDEIFLKARAVEIGKYFPMRERFWLERLGECREADVIFVCGDLHIESFGNILDAENIPYSVVARGIGLTEEDARFNQAVEYLRVHPELARCEDL